MQPSRYPVDWNWLSAVWRQFVTTGVLDPSLDPIVAMSWQRCALRYNPCAAADLPALSAVELEDRRNKLAHLIALVRPFMEDIHQLVENTGYIRHHQGLVIYYFCTI
jgi:transcriptional regulator of acetoin/glycerol metabolism